MDLQGLAGVDELSFGPCRPLKVDVRCKIVEHLGVREDQLATAFESRLTADSGKIEGYGDADHPAANDDCVVILSHLRLPKVAAGLGAACLRLARRGGLWLWVVAAGRGCGSWL